MSGTIAEIELPVAEFALTATFGRLDGIACDIERVVAHDTDRVLPFVWIRSGEYETEAVTVALADDPTVESAELLAAMDDEALYRMAWIDHIEILIQILVKNDGTIMAASGEAGIWSLRLLFTEHEALSRTHDYCTTHGLTFDVQRIYKLDTEPGGRFGLTDKQQDALATAFEYGYYTIPREAAAKDLANEIGVSHQALSELLRRGHENLVENTIVLGRAERLRR